MKTIQDIEESVIQEVKDVRNIKQISEGVSKKWQKDLAWNIACVDMDDTDGFYENAKNSHMEHFYSNDSINAADNKQVDH